MGRREDNAKKAVELMKDQKLIRNLGTAAHIDHGKTTFSDNLIAGAGMMSSETAGEQRLLDYDEQEAARGITINAASAAMVVPYKEPGTNKVDHYLVNLIDTPGHVDFGGDVTRAMRALDGVYILCCAVEGIMPQTETVIRQALKERVRPMLFINKVDRAIVEQQLTPQMMIDKFSKIITEFNKKIADILPAPLNKQWQVSLQDGTVALGSAYNNWAVSIPYLQRPELKKMGMNLTKVFEYCGREGGQAELAKLIPLADVALEMAINHIPCPPDAQKVRIPVIWKGDLKSKIGQEMLNCDPNGDVAMMVTKIIMDKQAGEIAIGRLFSGTVKKGQTLYIAGQPNPQRVQTVALMVGADRTPIEECKAGNIVALTGLKDAIAGSTVSSIKDMEPFEKMSHYSEPVITKAIEAKNMADLPKLVEVLRVIAKADPSLNIEINNETGEHLMSGMGELHLEITEYRIKNEQGVDIIASPPIVVYQESVKGSNPSEFEGKSPNKHNKFYFIVSPLEDSVKDAIRRNEIDVDSKIKDPKAPVPARDHGAREAVLRGGHDEGTPRQREGRRTQGVPHGRQAARGHHPQGTRTDHPRRQGRYLRSHVPGRKDPARAHAEAVRRSSPRLHGRSRQPDQPAPRNHPRDGSGGFRLHSHRRGARRGHVRILVRHPWIDPGTRNLVPGERRVPPGPARASEEDRHRDQDPQGTQPRALRRQVLRRPLRLSRSL